MRILLKILLFPISFVLTILVHVSCFLVGTLSGLLNILSFFLFLGALLMAGFAIFGSGYSAQWQPAIGLIVVSFIISPYGLPSIAAWLVGKVDSLNDFIKAI